MGGRGDPNATAPRDRVSETIFPWRVKQIVSAVYGSRDTKRENVPAARRRRDASLLAALKR